MKKFFIILAVISIIILAVFVFFEIKNEKERIDVYVTTNLYAQKIEKIATNSDEYEGSRISITGYIHYDEYNNCFIVRDYLRSDGTSRVGILIIGDHDSFKEDDWVKVIGVINYRFTDYMKGTKVPYIKIEKIEKVKLQDGDRLVLT